MSNFKQQVKDAAERCFDADRDKPDDHMGAEYLGEPCVGKHRVHSVRAFTAEDGRCCLSLSETPQLVDWDKAARCDWSVWARTPKTAIEHMLRILPDEMPPVKGGE